MLLNGVCSFISEIMDSLDLLLEEAGFEDIEKTNFAGIVKKTPETQKRYSHIITIKFNIERGIPYPKEKIYQIFTAKEDGTNFDYNRFYELSEQEVRDICKKHSTIQKEGIKPKYTGREALDIIIKIKKERQKRNNLIQNPANIF